MRIGIDARFFGIRQKGLGRYTQKLIENLEKIAVADGNQYFVFLKKENFDEYQPKNSNFHKVLADFQWYTFAEQFFLPRVLYRFNLDLMHFPHFNVPILYFRKFVVTIHDLTLLHFPTVKNSTLHPIMYRLKFLAYRAIIKLAIIRARHIITISQFTKKDIVNNYGKAIEEKISITYESCEDHCMFSVKNSQEILQKYGIIKPYLIYVGNAYPHKNLERLVMAFSQISQDFQLVLVGKRDYFYDRLNELISRRGIKNIVLLSNISDYTLDILFRQSIANVFPSLYEGFGLPPLEAMSKGVPVISSDHPCMREILGESAFFFDGKDTGAIVIAMKRIIAEDALRKDLIARGYEQIKKYSWKKMAQETQEVYKKVLT